MGRVRRLARDHLGWEWPWCVGGCLCVETAQHEENTRLAEGGRRTQAMPPSATNKKGGCALHRFYGAARVWCACASRHQAAGIWAGTKDASQAPKGMDVMPLAAPPAGKARKSKPAQGLVSLMRSGCTTGSRIPQCGKRRKLKTCSCCKSQRSAHLCRRSAPGHTSLQSCLPHP